MAPEPLITSQPTDEELLLRVAAKDESSLAALHERYRGLAFALAYRVVHDRARAEDVVQDAFLAVWRKAGSYRPGRGSARTWLSTVVRNRAIDIVRASRERAVQEDEEILLSIRDHAPSVFDQVATAIDGEMTRAMLRELPNEQRQAITLAFFAGLSHSEIAERTGLPLGTVKSRVRLGVQRMRQSLTPAPAA